MPLLWLIVLLLLLSPLPLRGEEGAVPFKLHGQAAQSACASCHAWRKPVAKKRPLKKPHDAITMNHGTLWCHQCHLGKKPHKLQLMDGGSDSFEHAYRQCRACHARTVRDWQGGAHGKRVGGWQAPRRIMRCSGCHDPHDPALKPFQPAAPPLPVSGHLQ